MNKPPFPRPVLVKAADFAKKPGQKPTTVWQERESDYLDPDDLGEFVDELRKFVEGIVRTYPNTSQESYSLASWLAEFPSDSVMAQHISIAGCYHPSNIDLSYSCKVGPDLTEWQAQQAAWEAARAKARDINARNKEAAAAWQRYDEYQDLQRKIAQLKQQQASLYRWVEEQE